MKAKSARRAERLARALKANLKRRKAAAAKPGREGAVTGSPAPAEATLYKECDAASSPYPGRKEAAKGG